MPAFLSPLLLLLLVFRPSLSQPTDNISNPPLRQPSNECPTLFTSQDPPPSPAPSLASLPTHAISPNLAFHIAALLYVDVTETPHVMTFGCTAVFINPATLVVPADCVQIFDVPTNSCRLLDELYLSTSPAISSMNISSPPPPGLVPISDITVHPAQKCDAALYNIALIHLDQELPETRPITISSNSSLPTELSVVRSLGYTAVSETFPVKPGTVSRKSQIDLPVLSQTQCKINYEVFSSGQAPLDISLQVCAGDSDRNSQCLKGCPPGSILIQYDADNNPVLVAFHAPRRLACNILYERVFLRAGPILDWIREHTRGPLTEAADVRQQPLPATRSAVPLPESERLSQMTSGMLVGAVVVVSVVALVGVIAVVSVFKRRKQQRSGEDVRARRNTQPRTAEEIFEQMEMEMSNMSTTDAAASSLYPSTRNVHDKGDGVGSPHASGSLGAPFASGSVGSPYVSGSVGAPYASGSMGAPYASGSMGAPYASGSMGAPYASGSMGAPYGRGIGQSATVRGPVQKHPIRLSDALEP